MKTVIGIQWDRRKHIFLPKKTKFFLESKGNFETNKQTHPKDMRAKKRENYVTQGFLIFWGVFFGLFEMKDAVIRIPRQYIPIEFL